MTCNHSYGSCLVLSQFSLEFWFLEVLKKIMKKYELLEGFLWKGHIIIVLYHGMQSLQDYK